MAPIDGLTLSASYYDFGEMGKKTEDKSKKVVHRSANLLSWSVSFGYGETKHAPAQRMGGHHAATAKLIQHYENMHIQSVLQ